MSGKDVPALTAGVITLSFELPAHSLKEKRSMVRPLVERIRARFNASVVEAGNLDDARTATLAAICLSTDSRYLQGQLQAILGFVEGTRTDAVLVDVATESFVL